MQSSLYSIVACMDTKDAGRKGGLASVANRRRNPERLRAQMSNAAKARHSKRNKRKEGKEDVKPKNKNK